MKKLNAAISSRVNRSLVLTEIHRRPGISRVELSAQTGLGRSAVTEILHVLLHEGLVEELASSRRGNPNGRPRVSLRVRPLARTVAAIAIDWAEATLALSGLDGKELWRGSAGVQQGEPLLGLIERLLRRCEAERAEEFRRLVAVGVSVPGVVDAERGILRANIFHGWANEDLGGFLRRTFGVFGFAENNAKAAALGEVGAAGTKQASIVYLHGGLAPSGRALAPLAVGGAAVLQGELWRGANLYGGEICGEINAAAEDYAGAWIGREPSVAEWTLPQLAAAARGGNAEASGAISVLADSIGQTLAVIATFVDPQRVLVHLRPALLEELLLPRVEEIFRRKCHHLRGDGLLLQRAPLGNEAPLRGLLELGLRRIFVEDSSHASLLFAEG
jgi:predicted NBD/HSP70 family sugar kinase